MHPPHLRGVGTGALGGLRLFKAACCVWAAAP